MAGHLDTGQASRPRSTSPDPTRSNELTSLREVWRAFRRSPSGRVILGVLALSVVVRLLVGDWGRGDLVVALVVVALVGPVEWVIHQYLLHASPDAWTSRRLGTGAGHRQHHLDPPELKWLLLRGTDAAIFLVLLAIVTAVWAPLPAWLLGGAALPPTVTAFVATVLALGHYEWTHLLVHSAHRPRSRYYARLARNHRRHHYRNEGYWLGVTSNVGDRLLRTHPRSAGDVPVSGTARTLGDGPVD